MNNFYSQKSTVLQKLLVAIIMMVLAGLLGLGGVYVLRLATLWGSIACIAMLVMAVVTGLLGFAKFFEAAIQVMAEM